MFQPIYMTYERGLDADPLAVGALLDSLAGEDDRLWPTARWPPIRLDGPLEVGTRGGHGPIGYEVCDYEPGRRVCFRFDPRLFAGCHWFEVAPCDGGTLLSHVTLGEPRGWLRVAWPLVLGRLHALAIEDCFDHAQAQLRGVPWRPRPLDGPGRVLHALSRLYPQ